MARWTVVGPKTTWFEGSPWWACVLMAPMVALTWGMCMVMGHVPHKPNRDRTFCQRCLLTVEQT